ncbi:MAG: hypothetical protein K940chlam9_01067 [Chlamydiae bacterium]|nr:hypothetical protein [Chlamydiota bacterium]
MGKTKTFGKQKVSSKSTQRKQTSRKIKADMCVDVYDPTEALLDEDKIGRVIWECLKEGDAEGVIEIIQIHLAAVNKTQFAKKAQIPKTPMYHSFRSKNPTIKTLAKLVHAFA